jgi:hypothetical protein
MRSGLLLSVAAHALILAWGLFALPSSQMLDPSQFESLPIELVTMAEVTDLALGQEDAAPQETPSANDPAPVAEAEPPPPPPPPPAPEPPPPEPEPEPPPPPEPAPPPEPEPPPVEEVAEAPPPPQPEPPPPEPAPEPDPEPAPPPPPKPEPAPEPEPTPAPQPVAVASAEPVPVPRARPRPPPRPPEPRVTPPEPEPEPPAAQQRQEAPEPADEFTDDIATLLDREEQPEAAPDPSDQVASLGVDRGSLEALMSQGVYDGLIGQVKACWSPMQGVIESQQTVKARLSLNRDGTLREEPSIIESGIGQYGPPANDAALRAIRNCAPLDVSAFPSDRYEEWQDINITFRWSDY